MTSRGDSNVTASAGLYRMLVDWNSSASWLTMLTSGPGVQRDDVEAASAADATVANLSVVPSVFAGSGMVNAVQSWANGAPKP